MEKEQLLRFSIESGADEAIGETVRNYFVAAAPKENITSVSKPQSKPAVSPAAKIATGMQPVFKTLAELESAVRVFDGCGLKKLAQKTVFADGNPNAKVMVIGEAPGADEDVQGIPFCGMSGKLLRRILATIGLTVENNLYISNTVFWRPPGNRQPTKEETALCLPFVEQHIALVKPKVLLLAGGTATSTLLGREEAMSRLRGKTYNYQNQYMDAPLATMVTYHPSYLLRSPTQKRSAWQDMLMLQSLL